MKNYIILIVFASLVSGCNKDFLDRYPKDALSPNTFWKTKKDADLALTGLYRGFESADNLLYRDCGSDNGYNNFPWEGWRPIGDGTVSASNSGSSYFGFSTINRCNEFLKSVKDMELTGKEIYLAQARFLRAYRYYVLTVNYGDVPLVTTVFANPDEAKVPRDDNFSIVSY